MSIIRQSLTALRRTASRLTRDASGNVALLFAITVPVLLMTVGAGIDFSRGADAKVKLTSALDTAVLAAAEEASRGETDLVQLQALAQAVFDANTLAYIDTYAVTPTVTLNIDTDEKIVTGQADGRVDHALFVFDGLTSTNVAAESVAAYDTLDIELAMMLDVTGSMSGQKLADLKLASVGVVDTLLDPDNRVLRDKVRISLVPYSAAVNAGDYAEDVTGVAGARCVVERAGPGAYRDTAPRIDPIAVDPDAYCPGETIEPLTNRPDVLKETINDFTAGGCTAGHLGASWAYYTLSPNWNGVWPVESQPKIYGGENTMKVALLMTDGEFNTFYQGVANPICSGQAANRSSQTTERICDEMKRNDILIYSVAFQAPPSAETLLRDCASTDDQYFDVDSGEELIQAFQEIAGDIRNLRLTK